MNFQLHRKLINEIKIETSNGSCVAKIDLNKGGSVQHLMLQNKTIIHDQIGINYASTFASAILFPFVNRVENGIYDFKGNRYELFKNQAEEQHAIHGLVYNKTFEIKEEIVEPNYSMVCLQFDSTDETEGFPFSYSIQLVYTLTEELLSLLIKVKNTDKREFPFSLGWHPYFWSSDLSNSLLLMESNAHIVKDDRNIPLNSVRKDIPSKIQIKDKIFDNCYVLNDNRMSFITPDYEVDIEISDGENYVQLFTPPGRNCIAIEPLTSPSNSFNNKIGLMVLQSDELFSRSWAIKLKTDN